MSKLTERLREISNSDGLQFEAADRIEHLERVLVQAREAFDSALESARLLGFTQCKKSFGCHSGVDALFEAAMYQSIAKKRAAIDEALKEKT